MVVSRMETGAVGGAGPGGGATAQRPLITRLRRARGRSYRAAAGRPAASGRAAEAGGGRAARQALHLAAVLFVQPGVGGAGP
jgi:hypothetical protein